MSKETVFNRGRASEFGSGRLEVSLRRVGLLVLGSLLPNHIHSHVAIDRFYESPFESFGMNSPHRSPVEQEIHDTVRWLTYTTPSWPSLDAFS